MSNTIERYRKYPDSVRFLMLIDKLHISCDFGLATINIMLDKDISKCNNDENGTQKRQRLNNDKTAMNKTMGMIKDELVALEDYIQSPISDGLKRIEEKVDQISLSPDCPEGRKMMKNAEKSFYISQDVADAISQRDNKK